MKSAARQTWTDDQRINSPTLYHAELGRQQDLTLREPI